MKKNTWLIVAVFTLAAITFPACQGTQKTNPQDNDSLSVDSIAEASNDNIDWQDVSIDEAVAFVREFYTHTPKEQCEYWDEEILKKYLGPQVLQELKDSADVIKAAWAKDGGNLETNYASWLLTCTDVTGQIVLATKPAYDVEINDEGRCSKRFCVFYFGDGFMSSEQTLEYTVQSHNNRLYITKIDGMCEAAVDDVWQQLMDKEEYDADEESHLIDD